MKRLALSISVLSVSVFLSGPALATNEVPPLGGNGGECIGIPLPPRGSVDEHYRNALEMLNRYQTGPADCKRLGGTYHSRPKEITEAEKPSNVPTLDERARREQAIRDYRQAMADWRSSDSCDKLAAKMTLVGNAIATASGIAFYANKIVGGAGIILGFSVSAQGVIIGSWVCTD